MTKDYGEIICTAVDEIVRARISSLEFNVTKTCTIIDISSRKQGKYGVSDGSVSFIALSEDTTYNLDDSVLVLIPNGDYKNDKLILSKINKETELPYNYTSPMSMMVTLTDNVLGTDKYGEKPEVENEGLLANEPAAADKEIGTSVVLYELTKNLDQLNGFTRIGLSVDFKSLLNNLNVHSGTYGVFIEIHSKAGEQGAEKDLATILPFDCNEMAGNPYNFTSFFTQEKVFDISYIQNIQSIQVVFYQGADFKDAQGELVPYQYIEFPSNQSKNYNNNLFASNVKMYFGQGVNEFDKETITLYTNDVPSYHYTRDNEKTLNIRWVHKVDDNTYIPLSGVGLDTTKYEVRWYRYNSATTNIDEYAGEGWERIGGLAANTFSIKFTPDIKNIKEKIKVIGIVRDGSVVSHSSNILELTNEEYVPDQAIFDVSSGLTIGCLDDTAGNYYLYDQNGYLNNSGLGQGYTRMLAPLWNGVQIDYDTFAGKKVDFVEWWFPSDKTMTICEETENIQEYNGINYKVFRYIPGTNWGKNDIAFDYSIKNYWAKKESNNTIRCIVSVNGTEYSALKELQFGRAGSNGTNLTMVLEFSGNNNALVIKGDPIQVEARLYDSNGSRIDFTKEQAAAIAWSWYKSTPDDENYGAYMSHSANEDNATRTITLNSALGGPPIDNYFILQATYKADILSTELTAFLPIPIKMAECSHIEGAKEVIYNHQGTPSYYKDAYKAFKRVDKVYEEYENLEWTCTSTNDDASLTPHLSKEKSGGLVAPQFFVDGQNDQVCVRCKYWSQPILIMQSKYDFALLNSWDENLTIDENNGTILSTMLGAGKKVNNVFSGVLIGDIQGGLGYQATERHTGVYGFSEGQMSFGFKDDGTAFIGKSGKGQILFDGNQGTIKSNNIDLTITTENEKEVRTITGTGLLLDMDDAHISIHGKNDPDSQKIYFDVWREDDELIHIGDDEYYLQSANYEAGAFSIEDGIESIGGQGIHIDLETGAIDASNLYITSKNLLINSKDSNLPYFMIKDDDGCNLFYASKNHYYLQSHGFSTINKTGMQIVLKATDNQGNVNNEGSITAFNFNLTGYAKDGLSYLQITSEPSIILHRQNVDLFKIKNTEFVLQSQDWKYDVVTTQEEATFGYLTDVSLNVRKGPSTSYPIAANMLESQETVRIYGEQDGWYSLAPGNPINTADARWVSKYLSSVYKWKTWQENVTIEVGTQLGTQIDVFNGKISMHKGNGEDALLIDKTHASHPLQIGSKYGSDNLRNFRVGWDGSIAGGKADAWSIDATGYATFRNMKANNINIGYGYIGSGKIGGCTISSNSITCGNTTLSAAGVTMSGSTLAAGIMTYAVVLTETATYDLVAPDGTILGSISMPKVVNTQSIVAGVLAE